MDKLTDGIWISETYTKNEKLVFKEDMTYKFSGLSISSLPEVVGKVLVDPEDVTGDWSLDGNMITFLTAYLDVTAYHIINSFFMLIKWMEFTIRILRNLKILLIPEEIQY